MSRNPARFIRENLRLAPVPGIGGIELHQAHPGSRLSRLGGDAAPYWAYPWAGGLALCHHIRAHPELVHGKRVLDLGAGSGLVGIIAAQAGAAVSASEIDLLGRAAVALNAAVNNVHIPVLEIDIDGSPSSGLDLILAGDVFYDPQVASRMLPFLLRCRQAGMDVLVGDPNRKDLPLDHLQCLATYGVSDFGGIATEGRIYAVCL